MWTTSESWWKPLMTASFNKRRNVDVDCTFTCITGRHGGTERHGEVGHTWTSCGGLDVDDKRELAEALDDRVVG